MTIYRLRVTCFRHIRVHGSRATCYRVVQTSG